MPSPQRSSALPARVQQIAAYATPAATGPQRPAAQSKTRNGASHMSNHRISVGDATQRSYAASCRIKCQSILTSLTNGLSAVINSVTGMVKSMNSYLFENSKSGGIGEGFKNMWKNGAKKLKSLSPDFDGMHVRKFLNDIKRSANRNIVRPLTGLFEPKKSTFEKLEQKADDFLSDLKDCMNN